MADSGTHFSLQDINALPQRYRANFVNSLSGFKSSSLLGTTDGRVNNLAIISSVVHVGLTHHCWVLLCAHTLHSEIL